ncbi:hypothetical protein IF1G_06383 [Cordyceps javanica]|uniref:Uncharacterized protein n=1 Tax=Cordyceps javanica TaxID=43265 RepID=A0A545V110_9HYPO|nr:hypothetical protein IF1G_06383 [Cordyceps javanica]TQW02542.1 hypothetical protein IF2G_09933 [Cordyceps javanica]
MEHLNTSPYFENEACFMSNTDVKLSLDLKLPEDGASTFNYKDEEHSQVANSTLRSRSRSVWGPLLAWVGSLGFTILYALFIYQIFILADPTVGSWVFDASLTNLLLSIFSQLYGMLLGFILRALLDALRWSLAARESGSKGVSAALFFQLSPATDIFSTLQMVPDVAIPNPWGFVKLALPLIGLGFGSVLKFQGSFEYHFIPQGPTINVFSGTLPPDLSPLGHIPGSYMAGFFDTWSQHLMSYQRYSSPWPVSDCHGKCASIFLPGSIETTRKVTSKLSDTVLQGGLFNAVDSIRVASAPGVAVRFDPVPNDFKPFDMDTECRTYLTNPELNDGIQLCLRQVGSSIAAGWNACTTVVEYLKRCNDTDTWARAPVTTTTMMAMYRQNATTVYDRHDLSIRNIVATSSPALYHTAAADMSRIWNYTFRSMEGADAFDLAVINLNIKKMAWKYRAYTEFFPDHDTPVELLRNVLAVPIQFSVAALQYVNYTAADPTHKRPFPSELRTTATGGYSIKRYAGPAWVAWTFIAAGAAVVVATGACFAWILAQQRPVPRKSGVGEVDFMSKLPGLRGGASGTDACPDGFEEFIADVQKNPKYSARSISKALRRRRVRLSAKGQHYDDSTTGDLSVLQLSPNKSREIGLGPSER